MPDYPTQLDLRRARSAILAAELAERPSDRYLAAHLAALQIAAVLLAWRANPALAPRGGRPRNVWRMLADVAPEFAEWAAFFAATQAKREAVRAGDGADRHGDGDRADRADRDGAQRPCVTES